MPTGPKKGNFFIFFWATVKKIVSPPWPFLTAAQDFRMGGGGVFFNRFHPLFVLLYFLGLFFSLFVFVFFEFFFGFIVYLFF